MTSRDCPSGLAVGFAAVRTHSLTLAAPLSEADCQVQSMPDASPTKWHLAHTTWFFETFVLEPWEPGFRPHHPAFRVLFNSYYNGVGEQHARPQRGLITRPTLAEVRAYRAEVDERVLTLLHHDPDPVLKQRVELGLQHEQQHQELLLTDVLHLLSCNPLAPAYRPAAARPGAQAVERSSIAEPYWVERPGGLVDIGHGGDGFAFDNEGPRHRQFLRPHALAGRLTTQGEWAEFMADGGYTDPRWWLASGWDWRRTAGIDRPLHWRQGAGAGTRATDGWLAFGLDGLAPIDPEAPVVHVSCYEADAYARWRSAQQASGTPLRLPTEAEWETAAEEAGAQAIARGNFIESQALAPRPARRTAGGGTPARLPLQLFGDVWEWTASSYLPYPGFRAWEGAVGEYNAKFMINQVVLRGGSCVTPRSHIRASYRNFFPPEARWQFSGLRLARDLD